jgi:hypothetical protein
VICAFFVCAFVPVDVYFIANGPTWAHWWFGIALALKLFPYLARVAER